MFAVIVQAIGDSQLVRGSGDHVAKDVMPRVKQAPGIVSATLTADEGGRTLNLFVFEDEQAARSAADQIRSAPRPPFMRVDSVELREVLAHF